jgi:hypothetical protein
MKLALFWVFSLLSHTRDVIHTLKLFLLLPRTGDLSCRCVYLIRDKVLLKFTESDVLVAPVYLSCMTNKMLLTVAQLVLLYTLSASALWPIPRSLSTGTSPLKLSSSFRIHVASVYPSDVHDAAKRTQYLLFHDHLARLVPDRGRSDENVLKHAPVLQGLKLVLDSEAKETKGIAAETIRPLEERDEAYTLTVPIHGEATITAKSALGLWRGLTTFSQIWYTHQGTGAVYTLEAPVTIADEAAYVSAMVSTLPPHIVSKSYMFPRYELIIAHD